MSLKNTKTTSDYIEWDKAINLIHRLYNDGEYRLSLLIGCGIFLDCEFLIFSVLIGI